MRFPFVFLVFSFFAPVPAGAIEPLHPVEIKEWPVADSARPRDPFAADADTVWFVDQGDNFIGRLDPASGVIRRFALADEPGPHNLIQGPDGAIWYTGNIAAYVGRFDPATGAIEKIAMPAGQADDPHTLVADPGGQFIWFTAQWANAVGRIRLADRRVELIEVPTPRARPYGIVVAPDGRPWVALLGTDKLASIDPANLALTEHAVAPGSRPRRIGVTTDGRVYYTDYRRGKLGRLDPRTGKLDEWALPQGGGGGPYGMAVDRRDRVWLVETGAEPNTFVGFDPARDAIISVTPIPSGAGSVRHMHYHAPSGTVWFGTDAQTIGRARVDTWIGN
jgi:virginiamycin B lyase